MAIRVGIKGFGRIGRLVFRAMADEPSVECVGINDLTDAGTLAHLLKYDSTHGRYPGEVSADGKQLVVDGTPIPVSSIRDPAELPWKALGVDIAVESTGVFRSVDTYSKHLAEDAKGKKGAGAKKVLISAPAKDKEPVKGFATVVMGVNDGILTKDMKYLSNASCTTNCLAPVAKVLHERFGIEHGLMTTVHAYTNDQRILDLMHSDLRRARSAADNLIPTTTGAAKAVGKVIPELDGRLNGISIRAPVVDGSVVDLVVLLSGDADAKSINAAMKKAAGGALQGILEYTEDPIVSSDVIGNPHSSIFDSGQTLMMGRRLVKVLSWYDNEWGFSKRMIDLIKAAHKVGY